MSRKKKKKTGGPKELKPEAKRVYSTPKSTNFELFLEPKKPEEVRKRNRPATVVKPPVRVADPRKRTMTIEQAHRRILERSGTVTREPKKFSAQRRKPLKNAGPILRGRSPDKQIETAKPARLANKSTTRREGMTLRSKAKCHSRPSNTKGNGGSKRFAGRYCKK